MRSGEKQPGVAARRTKSGSGHRMFRRRWAEGRKEGRPAVADEQAPPVLVIDHTGAPNGLTACGRMGRKRASWSVSI